MSMPSFPTNGANMTREEALTMIIASIAMEELALSHILNAEGEKLQYILGTLPGAKPCASPQDVLAVNKSVSALVEAVTQNQMLLKNKLAQVLDFCPLPPPPACRPEPCPSPCRPGPCSAPCTPPCRPEGGPSACPPTCAPAEKSALQLTGRSGRMLWDPDGRLPWRMRSCRGKNIRWDEHSPAQFLLRPGKTYAIRYTLNICAASPAGTVFLRQSPCGAFMDMLPLHVSLDPAGGPQTLQYAAILYPCTSSGPETGVALVLEGKHSLCVEQAVMDVIEL